MHIISDMWNAEEVPKYKQQNVCAVLCMVASKTVNYALQYGENCISGILFWLKIKCYVGYALKHVYVLFTLASRNSFLLF